MDFAGWFEAFLDGHWYTFDPRNNMPRIGRVLIARGRDAADVAISSTFGPNTLTELQGLDRRSARRLTCFSLSGHKSLGLRSGNRA